MSNAVQNPDVPLRIFISYSRRDEVFALELVAALEFASFEPFVDRHDIAPGERWEDRLGRLIEASDTFLFIISPESVKSERCIWEIKRAEQLRKRLLPVVWRNVQEAEVPIALRQLNYIFFDKPHSFGPSLVQLGNALRTDLDWVREHGRYADAAQRWHAYGRVESLLLRSEVLSAAKQWMQNQPKFAPEPTLLTREFLQASETAETVHNDAERKQLEDMAAAQRERGRALESERAALDQAKVAQAQRSEAMQRVVLRTRMGIAAASLFGVLAGGFGIYALKQGAEARAAALIAQDEKIKATTAEKLAEDRRLATEVALARAIEVQQRVRGLLKQVITQGTLPGGASNPKFKWAKKTLVVCFFENDFGLRRRVAAAAREWTYYGEIDFDFGEPPQLRSCAENVHSDVRVALNTTGSNWSFIGTQAISQAGPNEPTVSLDARPNVSNKSFHNSVLHEFGHVVGFDHSLASPDANCLSDIDWDFTYPYYEKMGLSKRDVDGVLRPSSSGQVQGSFDVRSVMHYAFPVEMFKSGEASPCYKKVGDETNGLSLRDKLAVFVLYGDSQ